MIGFTRPENIVERKSRSRNCFFLMGPIFSLPLLSMCVCVCSMLMLFSAESFPLLAWGFSFPKVLSTCSSDLLRQPLQGHLLKYFGSSDHILWQHLSVHFQESHCLALLGLRIVLSPIGYASDLDNNKIPLPWPVQIPMYTSCLLCSINSFFKYKKLLVQCFHFFLAATISYISMQT